MASTSSSSRVMPSPAAPTALAWPVATARRRWWRPSPSSTTSRSSVSPPAPAITSRSTWGWIARTREDPRGSMDAFHDAVERRIDYATVGDRLFVNNVSLGVYATIVQQDSYRDAKRETSRALLPEMLGSTAEPFDLQFTTPDGIEINGAFLIMVSNSPYVLGPPVDVSQRRSMETGTLGVFAVNAASGSEAARLMAASAVGLRGRDPGWHEFTCESFAVRSRAGSAFAGVDGEALDMPTPLRFRIHPSGMRVLVPKSNLEVAARRRARNVSVGPLLAVARGKTSSVDEKVEVSGRSGFIESLASRTRRPATSSPSQSPGPTPGSHPSPGSHLRAESREQPAASASTALRNSGFPDQGRRRIRGGLADGWPPGTRGAPLARRPCADQLPWRQWLRCQEDHC